MFDAALVVGPNSSIAGYILPQLSFLPLETYAVLSNKNGSQISPITFKGELVFAKGMLEFIDGQGMANFLEDLKRKSVLILNFSGRYGEAQKLTDLDIEKYFLNYVDNLEIFLDLVKFLENGCGADSHLISFSGAGVGGRNLDSLSPSYLASKASIAFLVDAFSADLSKKRKFLSLIAPGPWPSSMQEIASMTLTQNDPSYVANKIVVNSAKIEKLIEVLVWTISHPHRITGKILSANYDDLISVERSSADFGRLLRITE